MPAGLERIRKYMKVERTDNDLKLKITVSARNDGMISVDGVPINNSRTGYDQTAGWLEAAETILITLNEFRKQVEKAS